MLALVGASDGAAAHVSVDPASLDRTATTQVSASHAGDPDTLLALELNGEPLALDHGFPVRLIGPNRPGVMQTKWVGWVEVL